MRNDDLTCTREYRYVTGYQELSSNDGTIDYLTTDDSSWFGKGIYFSKYCDDVVDFEECGDENPKVLHVVVKVNEKNYLDLETDSGLRVLQLEYKLAMENGYVASSKYSVEEQQAEILKRIWESGNFDVMAAKLPVLLDRNGVKKEVMMRRFCLRNSDDCSSAQVITKNVVTLEEEKR